jgi:hypothetical protein
MEDAHQSDTLTLSMEQMKIATLERENFDLKMKVYYAHTNEKVSEIEEGNTNADEHDEDEKHLDLSAIKENEYCRNRISELERELEKVRLLLQNEAVENAKAVQSMGMLGMLEESRKREREVAKAISEHDASLIAQLQEEVQGMQTQGDSDEAGLASLREQVRTQGEQLVFLRELIATQNMEHDVQAGVLEQRAQSLQLHNTDLASKLSITQDTQRCIQLIRSSALDSDSKELGLLRQENGIMREQLVHQGDSISSQARALLQIQTAAQVCIICIGVVNVYM